jgi:hypothetical protein
MRALLLSAVSIIAIGCSSARPPANPPALRGTVVARSPRLDRPPTPASLMIERDDGSERVTVVVPPDTKVMEQLPDSAYRWTETSERWVGRRVHVWFDVDSTTNIARRAAIVVLLP